MNSCRHRRDQNFSCKRGAPRHRLDRQSLLSPIKYLTEFSLLKYRPEAEWAVIVCPAHQGAAETAPTLNVSLIDGHFRCKTCGAKGGDVVALHRLITGRSFREAVLDIGGRFDD